MMNLPTKITISRIALIPLMLIFYVLTKLSLMFYIGVCLTFFVAASTDYIDGYLARKNNQVTDLGKFLDPIADKILVVAGLFIIVDAAVIAIPYYAAIASIIMMAREFIVGVLRQMAAAKGYVMAADKAGKLKTMCTCTCLPPLLIMPIFSLPYLSLPVMIIGAIFYWFGFVFFTLSLILTVYSGINYIIKNKGVFANAVASDKSTTEVCSDEKTTDNNKA